MKTFFLLLLPFTLFAQNGIEGDWEGAIVLPSVQLTINVQFSNESKNLSATIDIPQQMAFQLPLQKVRYDSPKVYFELPAGPGLAVFDGKRLQNKIEGVFQQGAALGTFYLNKMLKEPESQKVFKEDEVNIEYGDVLLSGTLLLPLNSEVYNAVVFVTGSGLQDRDENIYGFRGFKILAEHLAENGIASLRYDDRGFGKSTGDAISATTKDFAKDAQAAVDYLKNNPDLNINKIGVLGHSEGALVAGMLASQKDNLDFIVLMAGSAIRGDQILIEQSELFNRAMNASENAIEQQKKLQNAIFGTIRSEAGWDSLENTIRQTISSQIQSMTDAQRNSIGDTETYINQFTMSQMSQVKSPWMKFFIDYNPADDLKNVEIPVLALFGEKDLQVPLHNNLQAMQQIFTDNKNTHFKYYLFADANHLFQKAQTGSINEYSTLKKEFIDGFLDKTTDWIKQFK